jgi:hypothetical protein
VDPEEIESNPLFSRIRNAMNTPQPQRMRHHRRSSDLSAQGKSATSRPVAERLVGVFSTACCAACFPSHCPSTLASLCTSVDLTAGALVMAGGGVLNDAGSFFWLSVLPLCCIIWGAYVFPEVNRSNKWAASTCEVSAEQQQRRGIHSFARAGNASAHQPTQVLCLFHTPAAWTNSHSPLTAELPRPAEDLKTLPTWLEVAVSDPCPYTRCKVCRSGEGAAQVLQLQTDLGAGPACHVRAAVRLADELGGWTVETVPAPCYRDWGCREGNSAAAKRAACQARYACGGNGTHPAPGCMVPCFQNSAGIIPQVIWIPRHRCPRVPGARCAELNIARPAASSGTMSARI